MSNHLRSRIYDGVYPFHLYVCVCLVSSYINIVKDKGGYLLRMEFRRGVESDLDMLEFVEGDQQEEYIAMYVAWAKLRCDIECAAYERYTPAYLHELGLLPPRCRCAISMLIKEIE